MKKTYIIPSGTEENYVGFGEEKSLGQENIQNYLYHLYHLYLASLYHGEGYRGEKGE
jgi:hypothetical protein